MFAEDFSRDEVGMVASSFTLPMWYRVLAIILGVMSLALALVVLVDPYLAVWLLIYLLAFALLVIGMDRLIAGISGHPFVSMGPIMTGTPPSQVPPSKP